LTKHQGTPTSENSGVELKNTFENSGKPRVFSHDVTRLENGVSARVVELQGNHQAVGKLEAMGIVPGTIIAKISASLMRGPVVVQKGAMQIAIGFGLAKRIIVEPLDT
jgi:ferrous iron transport protein A